MAKIEIFSSGCPLCQSAEVDVKGAAAGNEVVVRDIQNDEQALDRARGYGVQTVPAIVVDGSLLGCCENTGLQVEELAKAISAN